MTTETRYFRGDTQTINGLLAYILGTSQSTTAQVVGTYGTGKRTVYFTAKVSVRHADGSETVIAGYFDLFNRSTDGEGYQSKDWSCPETALVNTDAIVVRIRVEVYGGLATAEFITAQLGASKLDAATWTFTIYTDRTYDGTTYGDTFFGNSTYNSLISNFTWTPAAVAGVFQGDGLTGWS